MNKNSLSYLIYMVYQSLPSITWCSLDLIPAPLGKLCQNLVRLERVILTFRCVQHKLHSFFTNREIFPPTKLICIQTSQQKHYLLRTVAGRLEVLILLREKMKCYHNFLSNLLRVILFISDPIFEKQIQLITFGPGIFIWMSLSSYSTNEVHVSQVNFQVIISIFVIAG